MAKPELSFLENDYKQLTNKTTEILAKYSRLEMMEMFGEDTGSLIAELEAGFKNFQTIKAGALKNIRDCKQGMDEQEKAEESRRKAEESRKKTDEERKRKEEEELEKNLITIAQNIEGHRL